MCSQACSRQKCRLLPESAGHCAHQRGVSLGRKGSAVAVGTDPGPKSPGLRPEARSGDRRHTGKCGRWACQVSSSAAAASHNGSRKPRRGILEGSLRVRVVQEQGRGTPAPGLNPKADGDCCVFRHNEVLKFSVKETRSRMLNVS